jgi:hypothetical protein
MSAFDFEQSKENILPTKQGKRLDQIAISKDEKEDERLKRFNRLRTNLSIEDPLRDYLSYINYVNQNYENGKFVVV